MANFFAELKRRHIYRVAAAYAVVAWVLLQLFNNIAPIYEWPPWVGRIVLLLLMLGFPVTLIFARLREPVPADATSRAATRKLDWALIGTVVAVLAIASYQLFAPSSGGQASKQQGARPASLNPDTIALAVLPFRNLSSDQEQEFFSDGITQEIVTALAKIPALSVVARESSAQFKGNPTDVRTFGENLGATHLIEGSVRRDGQRVRITTELIRSDDGVTIWNARYDREVTDVFAIQEEIGTSIAAALRKPLGLKPGQHLVSDAIDPESYVEFLRGKAALLRARGAYQEQLAILEPVVEKNPNYAPAWAALARAYTYAAGTVQYVSPDQADTLRATFAAKMVAAARRAVDLDPDFVEGKLVLARIQTGPRRIFLSEDLAKEALALDPNHPDALNYYGNMLVGLGRFKEAVALRQHLHQIEPFIPVYNGNFAEALLLDGQTDAAIALWKDNLNRDGAGAEEGLAQIYASLGRYEESADSLSPLVTRYPQVREIGITAMQLLRSAPAKVAEPEKLPRLRDLSWVYLYVGAPERALEAIERANNLGSGIWHPAWASVRKTERFKNVLRNAGLVDYWRERGWPDVCRPMGADDFVCD